MIQTVFFLIVSAPFINQLGLVPQAPPAAERHYTSLEQASSIMLQRMTDEIAAHHLETPEVLLFGFDIPEDGRIDEDRLTNLFASGLDESHGFALYDDPYAKTLRRELGVDASDYIDEADAVAFAQAIDVPYVFQGQVEPLVGGRGYRLHLELTDTQTGGPIWRKSAVLSNGRMEF